jgi:hypothetical protein
VFFECWNSLWCFEFWNNISGVLNVEIISLVLILIFKTPHIFQHSNHQRGYSNIQNTTEVISTFKTPDILFQHSKHHRSYSNIEQPLVF